MFYILCVMGKSEYTDQEVINAIRQGGPTRQMAWEYIFKQCIGTSILEIIKMGGTRNEALECFNEVAIPLEKVMRKPQFRLNSATLKTYITKCVKRRWLRLQKIRSKEPSKPSERDVFIDDAKENVERQIMGSELREAVDMLINTLGERCRRVLRMFGQGYSMEQIAEAEKWKDADKAKKEKYECQTKLKEYLRKNPGIANHLKELLYG
ncbi:MAG: sigma-70 family RNA polymerase sigma factor [Saprospiraceae bacterium]|nr:sigma-70 family RNA polymerase sigma factor [Saprospiraceae bacterium]